MTWGHRLYTDGSKINGGTGSGFCYMKFEEVTYRDNKELNPASTVYEAELIAIQMACKLMLHDPVFKNYVPKELTILSDSLSAIKTLQKVEITGDIALETISLMNELGKKTKLDIKWIKAHIGHKGNEIADAEAKKAANRSAKTLPRSDRINARKTIEEYVHNKWKQRWAGRIKSSNLETFLPTLNPILSKELIKLSRQDLSIMVQHLSGHDFLLHHQKHMVKTEDRKFFTNSKCRLCNMEEETLEHLLYNCDALVKERAESFHKYELHKQDKITVQKVLKFIKSANVGERNIPLNHLTNYVTPPS